MKTLVCLLSMFLILTVSCEKNPSPDPLVVDQAAETLPFENASIKVALVTIDGPVNTRDMHFFNAFKGIAITYYGGIHMTQDGGTTWTQEYTNQVSNQPFFQICFTDANTGYVVGGSASCGGTGCIPPGGIILKTTDGGINWSRIYELPQAEIVSISANSSGDLFIAANGTKGRIIRSNDAGITWTAIDSTDFKLNRIILNDNIGFCTGMKGNILRTTNNGDTWELISTLDALYVTDIKFTNSSIFCIANNMTVYKSSDEGKNWTKAFKSDRTFYGLNIPSNDSWLIHGSGGYTGGCWGHWYAGIGYTTNSGTDWAVVTVPAVPSILSSSFYSGKEGFLMGGYNKGHLLKVTLK